MLSDITSKKVKTEKQHKLNLFKIINCVLFSSFFFLLKTTFFTGDFEHLLFCSTGFNATGNACLEVNNKNERSTSIISATGQRQQKQPT